MQIIKVSLCNEKILLYYGTMKLNILTYLVHIDVSSDHVGHKNKTKQKQKKLIKLNK